VKRQLMAEQWNGFSRALHLERHSETQRLEMRRAFYAGAESILFRVIQSFAPESEPTDGDLKIMEDLDQELKDFAKLVKAGRA
jgi:hypothetical protein